MSMENPSRNALVTSRTLDQLGDAVNLGSSVTLSGLSIHNSSVRIDAGAAAQGGQIHFAKRGGQPANARTHELIHAAHQANGKGADRDPECDGVITREEMHSIGSAGPDENRLRTEHAGIQFRDAYRSASRKPPACLRPARDLQEIQARAVQPDFYPCGEANPHQHQRIRNEVLPYLIEQQQKCRSRKPNKPGGACQRLADALRRIKEAFNKDRSDKERMEVSQMLAEHLLLSDCGLARAIVEELFDERASLWIKSQCTREAAAKLIGEQIHSA